MIFTNTPTSRALARCVLAMAPVYRIGGDSSSTTEDKAVNKNFNTAGGDASTNINADGSTIFTTDHGAVAGGLQVAGQAIDAVQANAKNLQSTTASMFAGALQSVQDSNASVAGAFSQASQQLATAYTDTKTPDKSLLMVGGVVVVGLVGVMLLARAKG